MSVAEIEPQKSKPEWQPEVSRGFTAKQYGAEIDFDSDEYNRLLNDLGIGSERSTLNGIEFSGYIPSTNDSDPSGLYDVEERKIYVRILKRVGIRFALTKKRKARSPNEINKDIIHETRHFIQHLGHLAVGEDYLLAVQQSKSGRELEKDAKEFTKEQARKYKIVRTAQLNNPKKARS